MSKKRKTRKQKEIASTRHLSEQAHTHSETQTYSLDVLPKGIVKPLATTTKSSESISKANLSYLKHDMISIAGASGIILAFDVLLLVLLKSGAIRLGFLGY